MNVVNHGKTNGSALLGVLDHVARPAAKQVGLHKQMTDLLRINAKFRPRLANQRGVFLGKTVLKVDQTRVGHGFSRVMRFTRISQFLSAPMGQCSDNVCMQLTFTMTTRLRPRVLIMSRILTINSTTFRGGYLKGVNSITGRRKEAILFIDRGVTTMRDLYHGKVCLRQNRIRCVNDRARTVTQCAADSDSIEVSLSSQGSQRNSNRVGVVNFSVESMDNGDLSIIHSNRSISVCLFCESFCGRPMSEIVIDLTIGARLRVPIFLRRGHLARRGLSAATRRNTFIYQVGGVPLPSSACFVACSLVQSSDCLSNISGTYRVGIISNSFFNKKRMPPVSRKLYLMRKD